jgi:hypothetical protein
MNPWCFIVKRYVFVLLMFMGFTLLPALAWKGLPAVNDVQDLPATGHPVADNSPQKPTTTSAGLNDLACPQELSISIV